MLQILALVMLSQTPLQPVAHGVASYYTVTSSSGVTSSGEVLDDATYTCAMPHGKFGSYYLVVAENGSSVLCRLNDRGPYTSGRVIDLSEAAMRRLDAGAELMRVKVYKIDLRRILDFFKLNFAGKK